MIRESIENEIVAHLRENGPMDLHAYMMKTLGMTKAEANMYLKDMVTRRMIAPVPKKQSHHFAL